MQAVTKIFSISSSVPQKPDMTFTGKEISDDVEVLSRNVEYTSKLYLCINEKPPPDDPRFCKSEEFLKGANDLERAIGQLEVEVNETANVQHCLLSAISKVKSDIPNV